MRDDLARAYVACPGWQWLPGIRYVVRRAAPLDDITGRVLGGAVFSGVFGEMLPDLDDPATLGCILELVRRAWGDQTIHVVAYHVSVDGRGEVWWAPARAPDPFTDWRAAPSSRLIVINNGDDWHCARPTVAEVLLLALQNAPVRPTAGE